jgi:PIN domain nuclease of toxin-antitoxin system
MRLLLDTHALLWWVLDDPHLANSAHQMLLDPDNDRLLIAQAKVEGLTLLTADPQIEAYDIDTAW